MYRHLVALAAVLIITGAALIGFGLAMRTQVKNIKLPTSVESTIKVDNPIARGEGTGKKMPNLPVPKEEKQPQPKPIDAGYAPVKEGGHYWYNFLSVDEQTLYKRIQEAILDCKNFVDTYDIYVTTNQLEKVIQFCEADHPEFFWVSKAYQYRYDQSNPDKILMVIMLYTDGKVADEPDKGYEMSVKADRNLIYEQRQAFNNAVEEFLLTVPDNATDLEKEKTVHDFVVDKITYDSRSVNNLTRGREHSYTSYGGLVKGLSVCEGYSELFQYLCNQLGMKCIVVSGKSQGENHQWNILWVNNTPVHVDPTWDDNQVFEGLGQRSYLYYNMSDNAIMATHTIGTNLNISQDEFYLMLPQCLDDSLYYYNDNAIYIDNNYNITDNSYIAVQKLLQRNDEYILLFFPQGTTAEKQKNWIQENVFGRRGQFYNAVNDAEDNIGINCDIDNGYYSFGEISLAAVKVLYQ